MSITQENALVVAASAPVVTRPGDDLEEAHHQLARKFHPDWNSLKSNDERLRLSDATDSLQAAYGVLQDPLYKDLIQGCVVSSRHLAKLIDWSRPPTAAECMFCSSSPVCEVWTEHQHSFPRQRFSVSGVMCRDCGRAIVRQKQRRTLWSGWWTVRGLATNVILVVQNTKELARLGQLEAPEPPTERVVSLLERPLRPAACLIPRVLLLLLLLSLVFLTVKGLRLG